MQLLWLIAAINALVPIGFGILAIPWHIGSVRQTPHSLLWSGFSMIVIGVIASLFAEQELKNGIAANRWPDDAIEYLKELLAHPAFTALMLAAFVASIVCLVHSFTRISDWYWAFFWPCLSISRVRMMARPERPNQSDRMFTPGEPPKPLHSDHWGNPPTTFAR